MTGRIIEPQDWIKADTGEKYTFDVMDKDVEGTRPGGFMIAYLGEIISMIDTLGNKKMQVVKYILANMDRNTNTLISTNREIANKSGVSYRVVSETLKLLDTAGIIERRLGALMLSPKLCNNWKAGKEKYMLVRFRDFGNREPHQDE